MLEIARDPEPLRRAVAFVVSGLRAEAFRPVADRVFPLEEVVEAHRHCWTPQSRRPYGPAL
ncbi:hypothetical protein AB0J37_10200 [Microbispora rosea]|uniref:hypothetical protein n=1 Tax=Microbispora rosea TaxID=58117 RepID=UPI00342C2DED